jgi:ferric-dicitrate binding protein FerR (iron transport regulator)
MENPIQIIEQALNAATLRGIYSLKDVEAILQALTALKNSNPL